MDPAERDRPWPRALAIAFTGVLMTLVFYVDLQVPLGVAAGVPYVWVMLSSNWAPGRVGTCALATICSLLTWLGFLWSPPEGELWMVIANRCLAVFAIWLTAFLCMVRKANERKLEAARRELAGNMRLLQGILDNLREGVFVGDRAGRLLLANPAGRGWMRQFEELGIDASGGEGLPAPLAEALRQTAAGERLDARAIELAPAGAAAHAMHFNLNGAPLPADEGAGDAVHGGILTVHDVTQKRLLEAAIVAAAETEQRRIGQDLHDGLVQQLSGVSFLVQTLQARMRGMDAALVESLGRVGTYLAQAVAHARRLSHTLFPVELETHGLVIALEQLLEQARAGCAIDASLTTKIEPPGALEGLSPEMNTHLFRIAQEALSNALRHAGAGALRLRLAAGEGRLALEMEDDGRGLADAGEARAGIGMRSMAWRAEALGGTLSIGEGATGGVLIRCEMRLPRAAERGLTRSVG